MQVHLLYVSRSVGPQTSTVTASILAAAQARNRELNVSGVLCQGQGLYLQLLEGERSVVNRLYGQIMSDRRHRQVELLLFGEIRQRRFAQWSMAHVQLADDDPMLRLGHPEFDPYAVPGSFVLTLLDDLLASGHRIQLGGG